MHHVNDHKLRRNKCTWWSSINYQFTQTILFFSIDANEAVHRMLYNESDPKHEFVSKKWLRYTENKKIQCKWLLFIRNGKHKWKETFKEIRSLKKTRRRFLNKAKSQTKNKNIWYKQTISRFVAFSSPISHVESTKACLNIEFFPLLIRVYSENEVWFMQSKFICISSENSIHGPFHFHTVVNHQNARCNIIGVNYAVFYPPTEILVFAMWRCLTNRWSGVNRPKKKTHGIVLDEWKKSIQLKLKQSQDRFVRKTSNTNE